MRAIIIDDKDARALLERLQLTKFTARSAYGLRKILEEHGVPEEKIAVGAKEIHGWFHYVVCSWLQELGANDVR